MDTKASDLRFRYAFVLPDGRCEIFDLDIALPSLVLKTPPQADLPDWTRLGFCQCPNCPLNEATTPRCPVAVRLVDVGQRLGEVVSHQSVTLEVVGSDRRTVADTPSQYAVRSLLGLLMAVSGCPHMDFFKPLARFHLPLASVEETLARSAAFYLLGQYFTHHGKQGAWDVSLSGLAAIYEEVQTVNKAMATRLKKAAVFRELNWIAELDALAYLMPMAIEDSISDLDYLFPRRSD